MKKNLLFFVILTLFINCTKQNKKSPIQPLHEFYKKSNFPTVSLNIDSGTFVLAPPSKFLDDFKSLTEGNFFVFYPRKLISYNENYALIYEYDTIVKIPNILIIPLIQQRPVKKGDYLLTWWQEGTGMQRAIVINDKDKYRPTVKYLDLEYNKANETKQVGNLDSGTFRLILKELDPGSSLMYDTNGTYQFFIVIKSLGDTIIGLSWSGNLALLTIEKAVPNPIHKQYSVNQYVMAPLFGIYTKGRILEISEGLAKIEFELLGEKITNYIPLLDLNYIR